MNLADYTACLAIARRHAYHEAEAADLLHEALEVGVRSGRADFGPEAERAWLAGVIRNLALARARAGGRRRQRESRWATDAEVLRPAQTQSEAESETALNTLADPDRAAVLARLSEGTRRVAVLALYGMNPDEICYVLQLKPAAFRQRLTALRRSLGRLPEPLRAEALALAYAQPRRTGEARLDFGLIRRALLHHVRGHAESGDELGTHDPDGHLIGIQTRKAHK